MIAVRLSENAKDQDSLREDKFFRQNFLFLQTTNVTHEETETITRAAFIFLAID